MKVGHPENWLSLVVKCLAKLCHPRPRYLVEWLENGPSTPPPRRGYLPEFDLHLDCLCLPLLLVLWLVGKLWCWLGFT